jgi:flagellar motor switch protein FliM
LVLPAEGRGRKPRIKANAVPDSVARPAFSAALAARIDAAPAQIDAVLAQLKLPLAEVMDLSVGMVLGLPSAALDRISIQGLDGRTVAEGKLGQHRGMRAIRLSVQDASQGLSTGAAHRAATAPAAGLASSASAWGEGIAGAEPPQPFDFEPFSATGTD